MALYEPAPCRACPPDCPECTGENSDCECYTHVPADAPLHSADPNCAHVIVVRMSGYGCTKCPGWYCA
jgi:hypothetical protein